MKKSLNTDKKQIFYDIIFCVGFISTLLIGIMPQYNMVFSSVLVLCIAISFFNDNFYIYIALLIYMRYKMVIGGTPCFRIYTYLVVIKYITQIKNIKLRVIYLPTLFVMTLHCIFATGREDIRIAMNVITDVLILYIVLSKILSNDKLTRRFFIAFLLGGISSGVFGWTSGLSTVDISVRGGGSNEITRTYGTLSDANFAAFVYVMCIYTALFLKNIKIWMKAFFVVLFSILLLQTASLSGLLTLFILGIIAIIYKYRIKSLFVLGIGGTLSIVLVAALLAIPQVRNIPEIAGILLRVTEKSKYIMTGRWDLLTTSRFDLWNNALNMFAQKTMWGKLFGGSVITTMYTNVSLKATTWACHQSYLQSLLNFGIIGTAIIYLSLLGVLGYRTVIHFSKAENYENDDIKIIQIIYSFGFVLFGFTVDFFIDWIYMLFYFI